MEKPDKMVTQVDLHNTDRAFGTRIAGMIAKNWGDKGFADQGGLLTIEAKGTAG